MGMSTEEFLKFAGIVGIVVVAVAFVSGGSLNVSGLTGGLFSGVAGVVDDGGDDSSADVASVNEWELSSQVKLPQAPSSADVYLFKAEPDNYGNYVDWDTSIAKDGLAQGVDYYATTGKSTATIDLGHIPSGTYYMVVTDSSYHTMFKKVTVPDTVGLAFAENDKKITLADSGEFDLTATYGSDNIVSYDSNGAILDNSADLPDASNNASRTVTFERTIEVDTGVAYLGSFDITSFNDGDGIEDVDMTIEAGDHTCTVELKDGSAGELSDSTSYGADLDTCIDAIENVEKDPVQELSEIVMTFDIVYDANTAVASAGDSQVGPGEALFTFGLDDIQDSDVSTATYALTG